MNFTLPPHHDGTPGSIARDVRQVTVIGANGSGKTRFTEAMIALGGESSYRVEAPSRTERMIGLLVWEEMSNLINFKTQLRESHPLPTSPLDELIDLWQQVFPGNKILFENGRMLVSSDMEGVTPRSVVKLSDGERAVLYYAGSVLLAPPGSLIFVDDPTLYLHPSVTQSLWDRLEDLREDCAFIYTTHDVEFASSRTNNAVIWVRQFNPTTMSWDYDIIPPHAGLPDDIYLTIIGARRPVLFIEGDDTHSIDSKLYPLVFTGYTVKALGSCDKVIESVRTFNDLQSFHHLESRGIVDRDRRDDHEVSYLRRRGILVPEVAEVENALMAEEVVRAMAHHMHRNEDYVFAKVKRAVVHMFDADLKAQAMEHTRHQVKRLVEYRIDGHFRNINMLENHMTGLVKEINPRKLYEQFCQSFHRLVADEDYAGILKVYNFKSMITQSNLPQLLGLKNRHDYVRALLALLRTDRPDARRARSAIRSLYL